MATVLGRIPLDEIGGRARRVRFGRTVLTVIAAVLYGAGWATAKVLRSALFGVGWVAAKVWLMLTWSALVVKLGWTEAQTGGARGPS